MRLLLTSLACLLFFPGLLSARIGETLDECVARYGPVIEEHPAEFSGSDPKMAVFSKSSITVMVEFRQGKAWHIIYRKPTLTNQELDALLKGDAGEGEWGEAFKNGDREFRLSADKQRLAIYLPKKGAVLQTTLQIVTREYASSLYASITGANKGTEARDAVQKKDNPLPGF